VQSNGNLIHIRVPRAFPKPVQGTFHLGCACKVAFNCSRCCHSQIVVAMHRNGYVFWQGFCNFANHIHINQGAVAFHCIWQVNGGCTRFYYLFKRFKHKIKILNAIPKMFGAKFNIALFTNQRFCISNGFYGLFPNHIWFQLQNIFHAKRTHCQKHVYARFGRIFNCIPSLLNISIFCPSQGRYNHIFRRYSRQTLTRLKIHFASNWKTNFNRLNA